MKSKSLLGASLVAVVLGASRFVAASILIDDFSHGSFSVNTANVIASNGAAGDNAIENGVGGAIGGNRETSAITFFTGGGTGPLAASGTFDSSVAHSASVTLSNSPDGGVAEVVFAYGAVATNAIYSGTPFSAFSVDLTEGGLNNGIAITLAAAPVAPSDQFLLGVQLFAVGGDQYVASVPVIAGKTEYALPFDLFTNLTSAGAPSFTAISGTRARRARFIRSRKRRRSSPV